MPTKVKFLKEIGGNVLAYFPQLRYARNGYRNDLKTCYAHIGQHSACASEYAKKCVPATPEEYNDLKNELISLGYTLNILNK